MRVRESVVRFGAEGGLVGVFTEPTPAADGQDSPPGFILLNSGIIHRVGPNRLYVKAARRLAAAGYPVLRFDLSGIGDSAPRADSLTFEKSAVSETAEAMDFLRERMGVRRFVLAGICSGADVSFLTAQAHPEVVGAVLINGRGLHGVTDDAGDEIVNEVRQGAHARYLWKSALFNRESWKKLLSARVDFRHLAKTLARQLKSRLMPRTKPTAAAESLQQSFRALLGREARLLLVYSEGDPGLDYIDIMLGKRLQTFEAHAHFQNLLIPEADHTFTLLRSQDALIEAMRAWADAAWRRP
jgi:pimeloyl-ACP methyl ester carboxylesterase